VALKTTYIKNVCQDYYQNKDRLSVYRLLLNTAKI